MNAEGTKRLALIKSLVREQGADGDKCWLIVQLETEAQALEAGVRIAELEAQVEAAREVLEVADLRGDTDLPHPANDPKLWSARMQDAWDSLRAALQPEKPQEVKS